VGHNLPSNLHAYLPTQLLSFIVRSTMLSRADAWPNNDSLRKMNRLGCPCGVDLAPPSLFADL